MSPATASRDEPRARSLRGQRGFKATSAPRSLSQKLHSQQCVNYDGAAGFSLEALVALFKLDPKFLIQEVV